MMHLTDTIVVNDNEIHERFVRANGQAGQNVRRTPTAVELRFDIEKSMLPADARRRLIALAGRHVTKAGVLIVVSRTHRSQLENREAARDYLFALLKEAVTPPDERVATEPPAVSLEQRIGSKKHRAAIKRTRAALSV